MNCESIPPNIQREVEHILNEGRENGDITFNLSCIAPNSPHSCKSKWALLFETSLHLKEFLEEIQKSKEKTKKMGVRNYIVTDKNTTYPKDL